MLDKNKEFKTKWVTTPLFNDSVVEMPNANIHYSRNLRSNGVLGKIKICISVHDLHYIHEIAKKINLDCDYIKFRITELVKNDDVCVIKDWYGKDYFEMTKADVMRIIAQQTVH